MEFLYLRVSRGKKVESKTYGIWRLFPSLSSATDFLLSLVQALWFLCEFWPDHPDESRLCHKMRTFFPQGYCRGQLLQKHYPDPPKLEGLNCYPPAAHDFEQGIKNHRFKDWVTLEENSRGQHAQPTAQAGPCRASCSGSYLTTESENYLGWKGP